MMKEAEINGNYVHFLRIEWPKDRGPQWLNFYNIVSALREAGVNVKGVVITDLLNTSSAYGENAFEKCVAEFPETKTD